MSYTVLKTSSILEPEVYVCSDYAEAARLLDGIREVMANTETVTDTTGHCSFRNENGHMWTFTIIERAALSPYWKPALEAA